MQPFSAVGLLSGGWRDLVYAPFRDGIAIHRFLDGGSDGPSVAVLKYRPGAGVPRHRHPALEMVMVLDGVQSDERGDYPAGSVMLNPPGSEHSVWTEAGCVVLIQWGLPVIFVDEAS